MLQCEGYKMFKGSMTITPNPGAMRREPYQVHGTFLNKPDMKGYWFCNGDPNFPWGTSFPAEMCSEFVEEM